MAYTPVTASSFKVRFPIFADVADVTIDAALTRARQRVDETWIEGDRAEAENLYVAHELTIEGYGNGGETKMRGFRRMKSDGFELERDTASAGFGLNSTSYGSRYLELLRISHPPIIATGGS